MGLVSTEQKSWKCLQSYVNEPHWVLKPSLWPCHEACFCNDVGEGWEEWNKLFGRWWRIFDDLFGCNAKCYILGCWLQSRKFRRKAALIRFEFPGCSDYFRVFTLSTGNLRIVEWYLCACSSFSKDKREETTIFSICKFEIHDLPPPTFHGTRNWTPELHEC